LEKEEVIPICKESSSSLMETALDEVGVSSCSSVWRRSSLSANASSIYQMPVVIVDSFGSANRVPSSDIVKT
jgi:hypothetical protein